MTLAIPDSTLIITCTAIFLGFMSNVATRLLVDLKRERRMRAEVAAFDKELKEATATKDKDKMEKLKKKKPQMDQMRLKASSGRFKVVLVTWLPFIAVYYLMGDFVSGCKFPSICVSGVVAFSPIPIPFIVAANGSMVLIWWYFLSSLSFSTLMTRLLGTSQTM
ncbi:MAG TPA: EMC3/TMCO1 family protein [Nitrososphaerales archaeon]|nr:EMC3/TMCO1 family protein [Nitrososphaerales archaeon]